MFVGRAKPCQKNLCENLRSRRLKKLCGSAPLRESLSSKQPFVKTAPASRRIDQMDFENPVASVAVVVGIAHGFGIFRRDAVQILVAGNELSMRKFADDVPRNRAAENPARILRHLLRIGIKLCAGD